MRQSFFKCGREYFGEGIIHLFLNDPVRKFCYHLKSPVYALKMQVFLPSSVSLSMPNQFYKKICWISKASSKIISGWCLKAQFDYYRFLFSFSFGSRINVNEACVKMHPSALV